MRIFLTGAIHTAFIHDWANYAAAAQTDQRAIETLGTALAGSNRPLLVTSGTLLVQRPGDLATEEGAPNPSFPRKSEDAALAVASKGVRVSVLRLPPSVHGDGDRRLNVPIVSKTPEETTDHFGWLAHFVGIDCPASSAQTRQQLGWRPTQPSLIPDIDRPNYFEA